MQVRSRSNLTWNSSKEAIECQRNSNLFVFGYYQGVGALLRSFARYVPFDTRAFFDRSDVFNLVKVF